MQQPSKDACDSVDVLVLGAGMCGLIVAQELARAGKTSWLVMDKGRSVGGRMATRRIDEQKFDHGAQFFTARTPLFTQVVESWLEVGIVKQWTRGFNHYFQQHQNPMPVDDGHPRYIGVGGMNQIAKYLAASLPSEQILLNEKIIEISLIKDRVLAKGESGQEVAAKSIVITSPIPQTLDLLKSIRETENFDAVTSKLTGINYDPCVALMGFFDPQELPLSALPIQSHDAILSFVADNHSKGLASTKGALTVHLSAEASRGLFKASDQDIIDFTCRQLKLLFGLKKLTSPNSSNIQRWRYARPQTPLQNPYLEWTGVGPNGPRIFFAGEAFGGQKIEGAFLSGTALARKLLGQN